jgi:hypothetical protein
MEQIWFDWTRRPTDNLPMKNKTHYRQGDVMIERIDALPAKLKPIARENGRVILAHGEVTGHAHAISDDGVKLFGDGAQTDVTYLQVVDVPALLKHDEHATIALEPGAYRVVRQREYTPEAIRRVAD